MTLPIVAIVGQPNVGKSTLLNKIGGDRFAVTSTLAGTTRDRQYLDTSWNGVDFTLVDTAGLSFGEKDELTMALVEQIEMALVEADLILLVTDGKLGVESVDRKTLLKFRKLKKPLVLVVNKLDSPKLGPEQLLAFQSLGIKPFFGISSVTGRGIGDLLDHVANYLKKHVSAKADQREAGEIAVSIVGKPNVGKSSLFNKILGQKRVVVSSLPGTTRTAIDTHIKIGETNFTFIDTAGLKKKAHRQTAPDLYSGFQTFKAIRRSDVALFLVDATEPITVQDQHIAQEIFAMNKGVILVANKIDRFGGREKDLRNYISLHFPFLWFSPLFLVSATTGAGLENILAAIKPIHEGRQKIIEQEQITKLLNKTLKANSPKILRDQKIPKVLGLKQTGTNPPTFELFVNYPAAISTQYRKYLQKAIIKELNFWGTPVSLKLKGKDKS